MRHRVLFILLDAFRSDYINSIDTPFLYSKISTGIYAEKLKTTAGFTQRTAIYTGTTGKESGMFTMYTFDADHSPFYFLRDWPACVKLSSKKNWWDRLPDIRGIRVVKHIFTRHLKEREHYFRQWIQNEVKKEAIHATPAHIPLTLLPELGVSEDNRPIHLPGAFNRESIFDMFSKEGIKYKYLMYPVMDSQDQNVLEALLTSKFSDADILMGQLSDSDLLIHHWGPKSPKRRQIIGEIDRKLRQIASHYNDEGTIWIVIGDHGMTDVVEEIDIPAILELLECKYHAKMGRDYLLFLDSTMARFKWKTHTGKAFLSRVKELPILLEKGRFIDEQIAEEYSIPIVDRRYGDLIWWANVGILLFPDYFHDCHTHNKGMHGYDSNHDDMKGFFLAFGPGISSRKLPQVNLIDVCPTICAATGVSYPRDNKGVCLLKI
jgi:predicted AlkP superfamily pyrophosphatase or phosphodiesterase